MDNLILTAFFLSGVIQTTGQGAFLLVLFNRKLMFKRLLLFGLVNGFASEIMRYLMPQYNYILNIIVFVVLMFITVRFILKIKTLQCLMGICLVFVLSTVSGYAVQAIMSISLPPGMDVNTYRQTLYGLLGRNMATFINLVITLAIFYLKMRINIPRDINKKRAFGILVNSIITFIILIPNSLYFENNREIVPQDLYTFNSISILVLLFLGIFNSIRSGELEVKNAQIEFQRTYIETLNDLIDTLRGFKHDFNNVVQVLGGYLSLNNLEGLKQYHKEMQSEVRKINNIMPLNSYIKDNPAVYGLLLSKISYCEMEDINFNIMVTSKINISNTRIYDFCKVLGVLLDNAIEAAKESRKRYVELSIKENAQKNALVIDITNSFSGEVDVERIFQKNFTTKNDHSGFGLWEVKKIFEKYKNCYLNTNINNNTFSHNIRIEY